MNAWFKSLGKLSFAGALLLVGMNLRAAQNVSAHYANGQVWVVWDVEQAVLTNCVPTLTSVISNGVPVTISNCVPLTYAIYWSQLPVTNTTTAALVGRLFEQEWSAAILRDDVNASFGVAPTGFRIPDGAGGYRVLATNEGVFVHTVRSNFTGHYAVRPWGVTNVPAAWRAALTNAFFSLADPPTCHLKASGTNDGYPIEWWTTWVDGDTNLAAARPDFPIMENDKRRGVPHNFSVTAPKVGALPATNIPACIAVHSGDGQAKMWLPQNNGFTSIGLVPVGELLIAIEDRLHSFMNGVANAQSMLGVGYVPTFDPFFNHVSAPGIVPPAESLPASNAVIIPFPLYRFNWTLDWLYAHKTVDSNRIAVAGQQLMLVEPAADALSLKPVMQQTGKRLVIVAVADEAGIELFGLRPLRHKAGRFAGIRFLSHENIISKISRVILDRVVKKVANDLGKLIRVNLKAKENVCWVVGDAAFVGAHLILVNHPFERAAVAETVGVRAKFFPRLIQQTCAHFSVVMESE